MLRRLLYWLGIVDLVWTYYYGGARHLRIVWYDTKGNGYVYGILGPTFGWSESNLVSRLRNDFKLEGGRSYLEAWAPYSDPKKLQNGIGKLTFWKYRGN